MAPVTRTRRPRKPETVLRELETFAQYVRCPLTLSAECNCQRGKFSALLSELRSALRERGKEGTK